jgi:hypothetical protein
MVIESPTIFLLGHIRLLFDIKKGIDCIERLSDEYGGVVRVKGLMGVSYVQILSQCGRLVDSSRQQDALWISDSRALEQMLLKAPAAWEASELFTKYVKTLLLLYNGLIMLSV